MKQPININIAVGLKLTEAGKKHYRKFFDDYALVAPGVVDAHVDRMTKPDKDGYVWWQLWHVMEVFGSLMHLGMIEQPFERNELVFDL